MAEQLRGKKKTGPKSLSVPKRIALRAWGHAVKMKMKPIARPDGHPLGRPVNLTPHELEKTIHSGTDRWQLEPDGIRRPKQFDYLALGEHWPRRRTRDYFNRHCPEVEFWLELDLWSLIEEEPPPLIRLHQIMRMTSEDIRTWLFERADPKDPLNPSLCRTEAPRDQIADKIREIGDLEAFTTLLALLREAELEGDARSHTAIAQQVLNLMFALSVWFPWGDRVHEIFGQLRKAVFPRVLGTMELLDIDAIHPDEEVSLRLTMWNSAMSAGLISDSDPQTSIKQMLLLDRLGREKYLQFLFHNTKTGRVDATRCGIITGYVAD